MQISVRTFDREETLKLGATLGLFLVPGDIVTLDGDLGAGKTVFTTGVASSVCPKAFVSSPTFTIVNEYRGDSDTIPLFHFDTYRLDCEDDFLNVGLDEYFDGDGICIIEWSSVIEGLIPDKAIRIDITGTGDYRDIVIRINEQAFSKERAKKIEAAIK